MGERVWAQLRFREEYWPLVAEEMRNEYDELAFIDGLVELTDTEANYGEMSQCTQILQNLKIPYDLSYAAGSDWNAGVDQVRFSPEGKMGTNTAVEAQEGLVPLQDIEFFLEKNQKRERIPVSELRDFVERLKKWDQAPFGQDDLTGIPMPEFSDEDKAKIATYILSGTREKDYGN